MYAVFQVLLAVLFLVQSSLQFQFNVVSKPFFPMKNNLQLSHAHKGGGDQAETEDSVVAAIRAKILQDSNYNFMNDPQAMELLESKLPEYLKELPSAVERLSLALEDAGTVFETSSEGSDTLNDIISQVKQESKGGLISSPQSNFFQKNENMDGFDLGDAEERIETLQSDFKTEYPSIPFK
jgi:hypothetical protein